MPAVYNSYLDERPPVADVTIKIDLVEIDEAIGRIKKLTEALKALKAAQDALDQQPATPGYPWPWGKQLYPNQSPVTWN